VEERRVVRKKMQRLEELKEKETDLKFKKSTYSSPRHSPRESPQKITVDYLKMSKEQSRNKKSITEANSRATPDNLL